MFSHFHLIQCIFLFFIFYSIEADDLMKNSLLYNDYTLRNRPLRNRSKINFMTPVEATYDQFNEFVKNNTKESQTSLSKRSKSSRSFTKRPKSVRREKHRHSTRVYSIKPAFILLPPIETNLERTTSTLNPFIINVLSIKTFNPLNDIETTTEFTKFENPAIPPPAKFLEPPHFSDEGGFTTEEIKNSSDIFLKNFSNFPEVTPVTESSTSAQLSFTFDLLETSSQSTFLLNSTELSPNLEFIIPNVIEEVNKEQYELSTSTTDKSDINDYKFQQLTTYPTFDAVVGSEYNYTWYKNNRPDFLNTNATTEHMVFPVKEVPFGFENFSSGSTNSVEFLPLGNSMFVFNNTDTNSELFGTTVSSTEFSNAWTEQQNVSNFERKNLVIAETGDLRNNFYQFDDVNSFFGNFTTFIKTTTESNLDHRTLPPRNSAKVCGNRLGYVADTSTGCKVFYICTEYGLGEPMLCPNGTLFNQDFLVCDWWYNVDCI